jgi:hypothetical protein
MSALNNLKSSTSWSFPPRPWTSHVCWIEPDVNNPGYGNKSGQGAFDYSTQRFIKPNPRGRIKRSVFLR